VTLCATPYGDANLDGRVDADDAAMVVLGRARGGTDWAAGNFNYDSVLDADDYILFLRGAATTGSATAAPATSVQQATDQATDLVSSDGSGLLS
jgi:hypothetical protein